MKSSDEAVFMVAKSYFDNECMVSMMPRMTYFARREYGTAPNGWFEFDGRWVVRDVEFNFVDCDKYRNDLRNKYPGLVVEGE